MGDSHIAGAAQGAAERQVQKYKDGLGPFVVAVDKTRIPMLLTNARSVDNQIVYANESLLNLMGLPEEDVLGMPFCNLLAREADRLQMTPSVISKYHRGTVELVCVRHDNSIFDASVLAAPVWNAHGEVDQYFISLFDLSEPVERGIQLRLRDAEIYRHAPGFTCLLDGPDHRFTFVNRAYEKLVGRQNLVGERVVDALPELAGQGYLERLDAVFRTGERFVATNVSMQLRQTPNGSPETRYLDFVYEPVLDADGLVTGIFCQGSDITEVRLISEKLTRMQAQLTHVSRMNAMGAMAATLAHEINQPLAAIANYASGCADILEKSGVSLAKLDEGLLAIAAASERAGKIIIRLRGMTGSVTPSHKVFDLPAALEEAAQLVRAGGCDGASMSIKVVSPVLVLGDKIQIQQVMVNLLRNACHAASQAEREGTVVAYAGLQDGKPSCYVRDNGTGLPAGMIDDPFKWTESNKPDGMGIGLSICRTIIEEHRGSILLDETGPSGTCFSFTLPAGT